MRENVGNMLNSYLNLTKDGTSAEARTASKEVHVEQGGGRISREQGRLCQETQANRRGRWHPGEQREPEVRSLGLGSSRKVVRGLGVGRLPRDG